METKHQEQAPQLSVVEKQKQEAALFVAERVKSLMREQDISVLNAVRQVYEEVKGNDYRKEQASAKLLELLATQNEVDMRKEEIERVSPELVSVVNYKAANGDKYLVTA